MYLSRLSAVEDKPSFLLFAGAACLGDARSRALQLRMRTSHFPGLFKCSPPSLQWALLLKSRCAPERWRTSVSNSDRRDGASALQWYNFQFEPSLLRYMKTFWAVVGLTQRDTLTKWIKSWRRSCASAFPRSLDYFAKVSVSCASLIVTCDLKLTMKCRNT